MPWDGAAAGTEEGSKTKPDQLRVVNWKRPSSASRTTADGQATVAIRNVGS